jgi:hypothetical protein
MKNTKNTGLGGKFIKPVIRIVNEEGSYNIIRKGGVSGVKDFYKFLN